MASRSLEVSGSSEIFGSGGTGVVSGTGSGGAGGRVGGAVVVGGGGVGLATGGLLWWQAPAKTRTVPTIAAANHVCLICLRLLRVLGLTRPVGKLIITLAGNLAK